VAIKWKKRLRLGLIICSLLLTCIVVAVLKPYSAHRSSNLFENPSFEETQQPYQHSLYFKNWKGWIYDKPSRLALGTIARTGKYSYELIGDQGGMARLISPELKLEPGRYRLNFYIRGLSLGAGKWGSPMDVSLGFNGKYTNLKKQGTFGWTQVSHVFEIALPIDNFMLSVGLLGGGWLWIDDVSLVKVADYVELTKEPTLGIEEGAIVPPAPLQKNAVHCPECGFNNNSDFANCYACGCSMPAKAKKEQPGIKIIANFEDGKTSGFKGGTIVNGNGPEGNYALESEATLTLSATQDWSRHDKFQFDVINPGDTPARLYIEIQDAQTKGYWTRVNHETVVPPGKSTVSLPTELYVGEKARPGRPLLRKQINKLYVNTKGYRLIFDNFRLLRLDTGSKLFDGLTALDFGPLDSPVMPGFRPVTMAMLYEPGRSYGWEQAKLWKSFSALQPDPLYQDFICPWSGNFRLDLPNGKYHVIMNIDSPGGYWGEVQAFNRRKVVANGSTVVDEEMDIDGFKNMYFRNAHREDLPGIDTFAEYVQKRFSPKEFDVEVDHEKLSLQFQGEGFAISLSSLVVYPIAQAEKGQKFWSWVTKQRRAAFNDYFKQVVPARLGAVAPTEGYRVFSRYFMKQVNVFDGPNPEDVIPPQGLSVTLAQGEEAPLTFSVQQGSELGEIQLKISDLAYADNYEKSIPPLRSSVMNAGWIDYRITRITPEGSVYTVAPRYWHPVPAPAAPGVTRTFWIRVNVPRGIQPGTYKGTITVKPASGGPQSIPLALTILPFVLDPISDVAVGPWGSSINLPWLANDPQTAKWDWEMFEKSLDVIKASGSTSFSGIPHLKATATKGKIQLDTKLADMQMALARKKGFKHLVSSYGINTIGYQMYGNSIGPDMSAAKSGGFPDVASYLRALYSAIDEHAVANNWLPVAWNLCDEPLGEAVKVATQNALAHRRASAGLKLTTFMGETSMKGDDPKDPHYDLLKALLMPSLNNHDERSLEVVRKAGNSLSFYNGGNRWTYGRYMKMLVERYNLVLRLAWHFNVVAGDPYYALDSREDDYCWFNTDEKGKMVPSIYCLSQMQPGLTDYRYYSMFGRLLKKDEHARKLANGENLFNSIISLQPDKDRFEPLDVFQFEKDRRFVAESIQMLMLNKH